MTTPTSLSSALPTDVVAFLVWKDCGGKTKVHQSACPAVSRPGIACTCPKRLAFGTVDSLIGKLRAIFVEHRRSSEWHSRLGVGNPAVRRSVKAYLANARKEQLRARIAPRQADLIVIGDLVVISSYIDKMVLNSSALYLCKGSGSLQGFIFCWRPSSRSAAS